MSRKLKTYKDFKHGTGVGNLDMKVHGISNSEDIEYTQDELVGSGIPDTFVEIELEGRAAANAIMTPGYSYIGDREIYTYGRKASQVAYPIESSGEVYPSGTIYIPLLDIPDGQTVFHLPDENTPNSSVMSNTGAAPMNVSVFLSGELSLSLVESRTTIIPSGSETRYYTDWFLPSLDELSLMNVLHEEGLGGFDDGEDYWSSSEVSGEIPTDSAYALTFDEGGSPTTVEALKSVTNRVRAIRIFYSPAPYSVGVERDEGFVFHTSGDIYWECALEDQSSSTWSNVTNYPVVDTSTDVGTGATNTEAIINQLAVDGWFLPSKDELNLIYGELVVSGDITF